MYFYLLHLLNYSLRFECICIPGLQFLRIMKWRYHVFLFPLKDKMKFVITTADARNWQNYTDNLIQMCPIGPQKRNDCDFNSLWMSRLRGNL